VHCSALRAIGATAALAFAASATTACSQDKATQAEQALAAQAKEDGLTIEQERWLRSVIGPQDKLKKPPPYSEALVPAKLGPNTFNFPMNLYDSQRGPDFQGSVGLVLEWPSLKPFAPGFVGKPGAQDVLGDVSINIRPRYLNHMSAAKALNISILPQTYDLPNDVRNRLETRRKGSDVYGLQAYYVDVDKLASFLKSRNPEVKRDQALLVGKDWYLRWNSDSSLGTMISCTTVDIPGAKLIKGVLEDTPPGVDRGLCDHKFALPKWNLLIEISYLRAYLPHWEKIEDETRRLIERAGEPATAP